MEVTRRTYDPQADMLRLAQAFNKTLDRFRRYQLTPTLKRYARAGGNPDEIMGHFIDAVHDYADRLAAQHEDGDGNGSENGS